MILPQVPTIADPKLHDLVISQFNAKLVTRLTWLNYAFGKCQVLKRNSGKKIITYPSVYAGQNVKGEYTSVLPDETLGNTSFFVIEDGQGVDWRGNSPATFSSRFGLIFWFNLEAVLNDPTQHQNLDKIKANIIAAIRFSNRAFIGEFAVEEIAERPENIYREFSYSDIDQKFTMFPYAGLRFNGTLTFHEQC